MVATDGSGCGFCGVHAQGEDTPLGGRHVEHEEPLRRCTRHRLWLAEEHLALEGIDRSILDINAVVPAHFVIADGIVGMEGNGPLHGAPRTLGRIVLADDPVAADFTCARLMGLNPLRVAHLAQAAEFLGNGAPERIIQLAEQLPHTVRPFEVLPEFAYLTQV